MIDSRVTGKTKLLGIIGNPIEHSISPQLHNTITSQFGLDFIYIPFRVEPQHLEQAVNGLKALNFEGFNVTIPYKQEILKYINEVSKEALMMGAVNTIKNINGKLYGYNTDAEGFVRSFKEEAGTGFKGKVVSIIGAGGAARAMAVKIAIGEAEKIYIINRTLSSAEDIADIINKNISAVAFGLSVQDKKAAGLISESDIVINTTSVGMIPEVDKSPVSGEAEFSSNQIVYDVIYNPTKTRFLSEAEKKGCKIINGLGMLFYQGVTAYEIWTGVKLSDDFIRDTYKSFLTILKRD